MKRQHGVVLTYVEHLDQLEDCVRRGGYDAIKVVTGWGVEGGWTPENKARVLNMVPNVIVRTVAGDPSSSRPEDDVINDFPHPEMVEREIAEWYHIKPSIYIEIGNEPNINDPDDAFIWQWRYYLSASIEHCRRKFPRAKLISGGLIMRNARRFCEIAHDVMRDCDYIGVHAYEYYGFHASQQIAATNDLQQAVALHTEFFADKLWYLTEYGINDVSVVTMQEKGYRYAGMIHFNESHPQLPANVRGAVYYHLGVKGDLHPEYHIYPQGDESYRQRVGSVMGGTPDTAALAAGVVGSLVPQLSSLSTRLAEREQELIALRDEAVNDSGENFTMAHDLELHQVQSLRLILEAAVACARDNSPVSQQLIASAMSRVDAWHKRKIQ
jgi:hypothetical protein